MMRVIINADDLGINPQRSHGIFLCHEQGVVTSASLIVNGSDSAAAAKRAGERGLPIGLHINLTEGSPISKPDAIPTLLTTDGYLLTREDFIESMKRGSIDRMHIEREIRAQFEWFIEHSGQPTHVDSHHHIHVYPWMTELLIPILDRYSISYVRIPEEPLPPFGYDIDPERLTRAEKISARGKKARELFLAHGIRSTDHFRGLALTGHSSMRNLRHTFNRLPEGTTELMVHPGSHNPHGEAFDRDPQRQTEINMLLDEDTRVMMKEKGVELCSFGDLF